MTSLTRCILHWLSPFVGQLFMRGLYSRSVSQSIMNYLPTQMVRKISQSQSSYRTKPDIIIDEVYESDEDDAGSSSSSTSTNSDKESGW